ncbi:MAG: PAC2 family protein [Nitrososphaerota archaeon]|nr:PAC2 family protein [Candidatus Geocrenenecus dongiae]
MEDVKIILTEEAKKMDLSKSCVLEASPSPGAAGYLALNYLTGNLKIVKIGEVRSPYFPQICIVNDDGVASSPKIEFYFYEGDEVKLILVSRNFPIDSSEGSYLIARKIYEFFKSIGVSEYYLLSSSRILGENVVYVASTTIAYAKKLLDVGARLLPSLENLPIDRYSAYMLSFFTRDNGVAYLLLSEVYTYLPDHAAAKRILEILSRALKIKLDMEKIDREVERQRKLIEEIQKSIGPLLPERRGGEEEPSKEPFYIG